MGISLTKIVTHVRRFRALPFAFYNIFRRSASLPPNVLISASHGSARIPLRLFRRLSVYYQTSPRLLLNFSDYGTRFLLESVPDDQKVVPKYGRIVGDPNRDLKQEDIIRFEDFGGNKIFRPRFEKRLTKTFFRFYWRRKLLNYSYFPFYRDVQRSLERIIKKMGEDEHPVVFVDVHDVGNRILGQRRKDDYEREIHMPQVVVSNAPDELTGEDKWGTAPEYFVQEFAELLAKNLKIEEHEVKVNEVYKGGNVIRYFGNPQRNTRLRKVLRGREIFALQVEFNRSFYLNETTQRTYREKIKFVRNALMQTIKQACDFEG